MTDNDALRDEVLGYFEQMNGHLDSHDSFTDAEMMGNVDEIIALVTAARDAEIREALESEELVGMFARMLWAQGDKPTAAPSSSYYMAARYNLDGIAKHIGLGDETGGQG